MSRAEIARATRTRDALLARVATQLEGIADELAAATTEAARRPHVERLVGFAAELKLIARPDEPIAPAIVRVDLVRWLSERFSAARVAPSGARVRVTTRGAAIVNCDLGHLDTIVSELLSNASKYAGGAPFGVRLAVRRRRALLTVWNPGTWAGPLGPVARFGREERRKDVLGFGVGVWLGRRLARANAGRLSFASADGETRAILSLPCSEGAPSAAADVRVQAIRRET